MPKLTKRVVDAAAGVDGRKLILWDTEVKGFGLAVTPNGVKSYLLNYRTPEGRQRRYTIGKHGSPWTCEEARNRALELLREVAAGKDPMDGKEQTRVALSVAKLAEEYLTKGPVEKTEKKASSWAQDRSKIEHHILPLLGRVPARALTKSDIAQFQADVAAGKTAADVKTGPRGRAIVKGGRTIAARATTCLSTMLNFAVGKGLLASNPAVGVQLFKTKTRERFLSEAETIVLFDTLATMEDEAAINREMASAVRLLVLTGCRKSEILKLRWERVDFDRGCLRLADSKTGAKVVQLPTAAVAILRGLPRRSPWVLPAAKGAGHVVGLQKAWDGLRWRATKVAREQAVRRGEQADAAPDLSRVRLHDLRHSFASFTLADGVSLFMLGKLLGHKQMRTTEVYAHLADAPLRAVVENAGRRISPLMDGRGRRDRIGALPSAADAGTDRDA